MTTFSSVAPRATTVQLGGRLSLLLAFVACAALPGPAATDATKPPPSAVTQPVRPAHQDDGRVIGTVLDPSSQRPLEFVPVTLKKPDGTIVAGTITGRDGRFTLEQVPAVKFVVTYGVVGAAVQETAPFTIAAARARVDLGRLTPANDPVQLEKFEVTATRANQLNSIDRKIYYVGKDLNSTTGSVSDILQNVPSVDVDVNGNVSLRGLTNVLILIDGRTSTLMGAGRNEILQSLPADSVERIEVMTNPSAKYKPDGAPGIINLVLKHQHADGFSGSVTSFVGNRDRYFTGLSFNYRPGAWNFFGGYSFWQNDNPFFGSDDRIITDPVTGLVTHVSKRANSRFRPFGQLSRLGVDYAPNASNQFGFSGLFNDRRYTRRGADHNIVSDANGAVTADYDRVRVEPDANRSAEASFTYEHRFAEKGHKLDLEFKSSKSTDDELDDYADNFRAPAQLSTFDRDRIRNLDRSREAVVGYERPLAGDKSKFEMGYDLTRETRDIDFIQQDLDPATDLWVLNQATSNHFILDRTIQAFYATYARTFGSLGVLAGVRPELTTTESHLVTTGEIIPNDYNRIYPSLHLSYQLDDRHEWQLSYSHRINRPQSGDLNPFPTYIDPFDLFAGNPHLRPEDVHSIETGYNYHHDTTSFTATAYYRYTYNGFTTITTDLGNGVLLTTRENLAVNRSSGLEFTANKDLSKLATLNFNTNIFFNTIDASNLGYTSSRTDISGIAKAGILLHLDKATQFQFTTQYRSARLLPQGKRLPFFGANFTLRRELWQKKAALVFSVSDVFRSFKEETEIDTPVLHEHSVRRGSSGNFNLGISYKFGQGGKKAKDDSLQFDN